MALLLMITPTRCIFGPFDTVNRYLRAGNALADLPITQGVTFQVEGFADSGSSNNVRWRYSVNGYVKNSGSLTADSGFTLVKA